MLGEYLRPEDAQPICASVFYLDSNIRSADPQMADMKQKSDLMFYFEIGNPKLNSAKDFIASINAARATPASVRCSPLALA